MFPLLEQISIYLADGIHVSRAEQQTLRREDVTSLSLFVKTVYLEFREINQNDFSCFLASFCRRTRINPDLTNNPNI